PALLTPAPNRKNRLCHRVWAIKLLPHRRADSARQIPGSPRVSPKTIFLVAEVRESGMFSRAPETRTPLNPLHVGERFVVLKTGADYKCHVVFQTIRALALVAGSFLIAISTTAFGQLRPADSVR